MYPFVGSPLNFGAARFLQGRPQMPQNSMFTNQSAPIIPRMFNQAPQPRVMPTQAPQMAPMQPQGLLSQRPPFRGQGGRDGAGGPGRGGGFGGGQRSGPAGLGPGMNRGGGVAGGGVGGSGGGFGGGGRY